MHSDVYTYDANICDAKDANKWDANDTNIVQILCLLYNYNLCSDLMLVANKWCKKIQIKCVQI